MKLEYQNDISIKVTIFFVFFHSLENSEILWLAFAHCDRATKYRELYSALSCTFPAAVYSSCEAIILVGSGIVLNDESTIHNYHSKV